MAKNNSKRADRKQMSMLFPIDGKPARDKPDTKVAYRSKEFYDIRSRLVESLPSKKPAG